MIVVVKYNVYNEQGPKSVLVLSPQKISAPENTVKDELVPHTTNRDKE